MNTMWAGVSGALIGLGLWLIVIGVAEALHDARHGGRSRPAWWSRRLLLAGGAGLGVALVTGWPVAASATVVGVAVFAGRFGSTAASNAMTVRSEAVASWAEMLRDTIVAGAGLPQALVTSARVPPVALTAELQRLARDIEAVGVQRALTTFALDVGHPACDVLVVALVTADRHGTADLVSLITTQVESTRHEVDLVLETEAGRARYRTGVRIMLTTLAVFALGLQVLQRDFLQPYRTWSGQAVQAVLAVVILAALGVLSSLGRPRQPARFFAPTSEGAP